MKTTMHDRTAIEQAPDDRRVGPILYLRGVDDREVRLAALVVTSLSGAGPQLRTEDGPVRATTALVLGAHHVPAIRASIGIVGLSE